MRKIEIEGSKIYVGESYQNITKYLPDAQIIMISDMNVYTHYKHFIDKYDNIIIPTGEKSKNWSTVALIVEELLKLKADRNTFLVGMGGGVVTDITGFVASVFMRGVRFGFIASSLLAQVDASLGGKNGINFHTFKNMIGVFNTPEFVICDAELLKTLPKREVQSGFGEIIKHALIKDHELFVYLKENYKLLLELENRTLEFVIWKAIGIKALVVSNDWLEKGERKQLNFGHTLGHAIENNSDYTHGEAVAVGMYWASKWSVEKGILSETDFAEVQHILKLYRLPINFSLDKYILTSYLLKDKKKHGSAIDFVFLKEIGAAQVMSVPMEELVRAIERL
ncbi:3-dehydroquinate synthase [Balneicella halophila]|uniref:3-dehydroquinate synthase n=1 Tax=Balneicella halophila TaxID=1537566 RepID=A0A7L4UQ84_BALHA|nr:3-dehydroquinate synthase [Balneicella halophila]PVX49900.1 3-dehydroquinate synthase [Balneicella halophila]